jgi:hypothetical protein
MVDMTKKTPRVLFICKKRNDFYGPSFGLINSCRFIAAMLRDNGIDAKVVTVIDNNDIDREVTQYKPTHCFIEALWVVPEKFEELIPLHPHVQWFVRIHSEVPFLANEGMAMEWLRKYNEMSSIYPTLHVASNSEEVVEEFKEAYKMVVEYFPNVYCPLVDIGPLAAKKPDGKSNDNGNNGNNDNGNNGNNGNNDNGNNGNNDHEDNGGGNDDHEDDDDNGHRCKIVDIGCFGAIRPMKNQLNQALSAIIFGNDSKLRVRFHINSDRCEQRGDTVLRNLVYAFKDTPHKLVMHPWMDHHDFIPLVQSMDLGMQVSFSETFNIVAADFAWNNIPVIGSDEIFWLDRHYRADPNNFEDIVDKLRFAYAGKKHGVQKVNKENLIKYNKKATKVWLDAL